MSSCILFAGSKAVLNLSITVKQVVDSDWQDEIETLHRTIYKVLDVVKDLEARLSVIAPSLGP